MQQVHYGIRRRLDVPFDVAIHRTREALKAQGFGVLTEIDVKATMAEKLGEVVEPYVILGACNPPLAFRAISAEREVGMLLPCNVVVREGDGGTIVEAVDPNAMMSVVNNPEVRAVAAEARERLVKALDSLVA